MIVITAPTGHIGSEIVTALLDRDESLRLIARDPARLPADVRDRVEVFPGSHRDPEVLDKALAGADALFVLVPPDFRAPDALEHYLGFARPIAEAVRTHRVPRVVAVSSLGRGYDGPAGFLRAAWAVDGVLESTGAAYRSLQPPFFMENLLHQADLIREQGLLALPADADAPHPVVAISDIARTAVDLLSDHTWTGQEGVVVREPVDHTPRELAAILSETIGRPVRFQQVPLSDYRAQFEAAGASAAVVDAMVEMAEAQIAGVYPAAGVAAGRGTTSFRSWCEATFSA